MRIRLHAVDPASRANGPGLRAVVWFQGCSFGCPGCFNPDTHDPGGGYDADTAALAPQLAGLPDIEGVSISGGEPFQQLDALLDFLRRIRRSPLSILVFSGHTLEAIRAFPQGPEILACLDVLIAGPYLHALHAGRGLLGSANQRIHLLTSRHHITDFDSLPAREIILHRDGTLTITGFARHAGLPIAKQATPHS
jgi:anaerobic ribonucleoside-triphosphate reductase activating protein